MDIRERAFQLLDEYYLCCNAKPLHDAINIQLEKDACAVWVKHLSKQLGWGTDNDITEAYYQLEQRLEPLKKKLVFEILSHGAV